MANASIKYLKDENGKIISPVVNIKSIFDDEGTPLLDIIYPVGSIYMSVKSTNPGTLFGGTWTAWGTGRVPIGINTNDTSFNTVEKTGGSKTASQSHTHSLSNAYAHLNINYVDNNPYFDFQQTDNITNWTENTRLNFIQHQDWSYINNHSEVSNQGINVAGSTTSSSVSVSTLQPYITCYMWKRTR